MTTQSRLRVGIVGCGYQGNNLARTVAHTGSMQLVACADTERSAAARLAAEHGGPPAFSSVEEMLAGSELDVVLVVTPHHVLHPVALTAVKAGKHVMVEKPVGINAQQVRELEEAVQQAGVLCLAGYSFRSFPALQFVRELVDRGVVGELAFADLKERASLNAACQGVEAVITTVSTTFSRQPGDPILMD